LTSSDRYGAHTLVIGCGTEMKYGGSRGCVQGGVDSTVEAVGGRELEIVWMRGF
jgi:hypothetical protein